MLTFAILLFLLPGCSEYITKEELPELLESYDGTMSAKRLYVRDVTFRYSPLSETHSGNIEVDSNGDVTMFLGRISGGTLFLSADESSATIDVSHNSGPSIMLMSINNQSSLLIRPDQSDENWGNAVSIATNKTLGRHYGARIVAADHKGKATIIYEPDPDARVGR